MSPNGTQLTDSNVKPLNATANEILKKPGVMELQDEQQKPAAALPLPVVPRLDRLDLLVYSVNGREAAATEKAAVVCGSAGDDDGFKPVSAALEEVHFKGTLMDRIAMLENRALQLSLQMDVGSTSRSSSFHAVPVQEKIITSGSDDGVDGPKESFRLQNKLEPPKAIEEVGSGTSSVTSQGCGYRRWRRKEAPGRNRKKLFEWLQI
uniref:Uncharacterized protein n=1 Tax=Kalanchoe fedtschenkoi TaxID=63787 RepID=A0A7N0T7H5_KALFE